MQSLLATLAGVIGALALAEASLRLAGYSAGNPYDRLLNHNDEYVGYRMLPGARETIGGPDGVYGVEIVSLGFDDGRGFRDDGRQEPVHSLFFGDSFVWGYGVEIDDGIVEQFEALTGRDAVNLGMTSFTSPTQYARLFAEYGPRFRADYAFFGLFLGNDFGDSRNFADWLLTGQAISYPEWRTRQIRGMEVSSATVGLRLFAYRNSALYRFVSDRMQFALSGARTRESGTDVAEIRTGPLDLVLDRREIVADLGADGARQIELVEAALRDIARVARASGTHPVFFVIPTRELVYQSLFPEPADRDAQDVRHGLLLGMLADLGLDHVDLLPVFREAVANGAPQLYFRVDGHWKPAGHALAAAALLRHVEADARD